MLILFWVFRGLTLCLASALTTATAVRIQNLPLRIIVMIFGFGLILSELVRMLTGFLYVEYYARLLSGFSLPCLFSSAVVVILLPMVIVIGFIKKEERFRAATWPRRWILTAMLLSGFLQFVPFYVEDQYVKADLRKWAKEANQKVKDLTAPPADISKNAIWTYDAVSTQMNVDPQYPLLKKWIDEATPPNPQEIASPDVQAFAQKLAPLSEKIRWASKLPRVEVSHTPNDPTQGYLVWGTSSTYVCNRLLLFEARYKAHAGDFAGALEDVEAMQRIALHNDSVPEIMAKMIANSATAYAMGELTYLMEHFPFSENDLRRIQHYRTDSAQKKLAELIEMHKQFDTRLICATYLEEPTYKDYEDALDVYRPLQWPTYMRTAGARRDLRLFGDYMEQMKTLATYPTEEMIAAEESLKQKLARQPVGLCGLVLRVPNPTKLPVHLNIDITTQANLLQTGIAAYRYALAKGEFPESLEVLAKWDSRINFTDPYSGQPLKMIRKGNSLTIYSIARDQIDDGGKPYFKEGKDLRGDLLFILRDPNSF